MKKLKIEEKIGKLNHKIKNLNYTSIYKFKTQNSEFHYGITLVALVVTIVVLLILAGITINLILGPNSIFNSVKRAQTETDEKTVKEKLEMILTNYVPEKYTENKTLETYLNEQKAKGQLDKVTNNGDGTYTVEADGYEIIIKEENLSIVEIRRCRRCKTKI